MEDLIYSSAVLTMSQTTEYIRNKSIDSTLLNIIIQKRLTEFSIKEAYNAIHDALPLRIEEIQKSLERNYENQTIEYNGDIKKINSNSKFKIPKKVYDKVTEQCEELKSFLEDSIKELFDTYVNGENKDLYKNLLLDVVTNLMSKYGYAYANQLAGNADATDFVPLVYLKSICEKKIKEYDLNISVKELSDAIGILFDRRDPCLNSLAFSICNKYYVSRLIGLDMPIDFITKNIFKGANLYLDTNLLLSVVYSKSKRHNEFREILKNSESLGVKFLISEITIAELNSKMDAYQKDLELGSEVIPDELLTEVQSQLIDSNEVGDNKLEFNLDKTAHSKRLSELGVELKPLDKRSENWGTEEFDKIKEEIKEFDRRYKGKRLAKNNNAIYHDAYMYMLISQDRGASESSNTLFLTLDNSIIEHGIQSKKGSELPYSLRLITFLQTLSQFVESHALKGEFSEMFGDLVSKDLLPQNQLFSISDLKLLIGFDIRAKDIPSEFVRKATRHIKTQILKNGEITEKNKSEAIHEFTKFLATPEQNFLEIHKKYDKKIKDRDEDIKLKDKEITLVKFESKNKDDELYQLNLNLKKQINLLANEKYNRESEKYSSAKSMYVNTEWDKKISSLKKIKIKYCIFIICVFIAFIASIFIDDIAKRISTELKLIPWVKYLLSTLIFFAPFIRSFFDHNSVVQSFKLWNKKNIEQIEKDFKTKSDSCYESNHRKPELKDFLEQ